MAAMTLTLSDIDRTFLRRQFSIAKLGVGHTSKQIRSLTILRSAKHVTDDWFL